MIIIKIILAIILFAISAFFILIWIFGGIDPISFIYLQSKYRKHRKKMAPYPHFPQALVTTKLDEYSNNIICKTNFLDRLFTLKIPITRAQYEKIKDKKFIRLEHYIDKVQMKMVMFLP